MKLFLNKKVQVGYLAIAMFAGVALPSFAATYAVDATASATTGDIMTSWATAVIGAIVAALIAAAIFIVTKHYVPFLLRWFRHMLHV